MDLNRTVHRSNHLGCPLAMAGADSAILTLEGPSGVHDPQSWLTGAAVKVTTLTGEEVTGEIYTADDTTEQLVLRLPNSGRATHPDYFDYRIIKFGFISTCEFTNDGKGVAGAKPMVPPSYVDLSAANKREKKATQEAVNALNRIGTDVSPKAQSIFNALSKTMPCEWRNKEIIVVSTIVIKPPYGEADCSPLTNDGRAERALGQVKRVLEGESRKLAA